MIPASFEYHAPTSLPEAIGLLGKLGQAGEEAKILSGGQSLLPLLKLRFARPGHLIDINRIPGLDYLKEEGGVLRIGALVREAALEASPVVRAKYAILVDTAAVIADPIVRNQATVCGNLAHGDPANDHPATMLALGAEVVATGPERRAHHPGEAVLHRGVHHRARSRRSAHRDPHPRAAARQRRRLREAGTQGRRLRDRGRGGVPGHRRRRDRGGGHRPHQPWPDADQGDRRRAVSRKARSPTRRRSPRRQSARRRRRRPTRIGAAPSSTSRTWPACSRSGR